MSQLQEDMEDDYFDGELELTEILLDYWRQGFVSSDSVIVDEDDNIIILWHYA